jgi:hypothetical protein
LFTFGFINFHTVVSFGVCNVNISLQWGKVERPKNMTKISERTGCLLSTPSTSIRSSPLVSTISMSPCSRMIKKHDRKSWNEPIAYPHRFLSLFQSPSCLATN